MLGEIVVLATLLFPTQQECNNYRHQLLDTTPTNSIVQTIDHNTSIVTLYKAKVGVQCTKGGEYRAISLEM